MKSITSSDNDRVDCHFIRRDMEYRLSIRKGKTVVIHETHRTPIAAAERAEDLRRCAMEGGLTTLPSHTEVADVALCADKSKQTR
jgi:hypothetical protein